jgi:hypothetical protein
VLDRPMHRLLSGMHGGPAEPILFELMTCFCAH